MLVNIRPITGQATKDSLDFASTVDLSHIMFWEESPFTKPIEVSGRIKNTKYGTFEVSYLVKYSRTIQCNRCLQAMEQHMEEEYFHMLRDVDEDPLSEDTYIPIGKGILDVSHMVSTDLLLNMDDVITCSPDCKGLCPVCGGNRNTTDCGCSTKEQDPRFDVLRKLLDERSK